MFGDLIGINTKGERDAHWIKEQRRLEAVAAYNANDRDYKLDPESIAALERGDRQRETGLYEGPLVETIEETHTHECVDHEDDVCFNHGYCVCVCGDVREWNLNEPEPTGTWETGAGR